MNKVIITEDSISKENKGSFKKRTPKNLENVEHLKEKSDNLNHRTN